MRRKYCEKSRHLTSNACKNKNNKHTTNKTAWLIDSLEIFCLVGAQCTTHNHSSSASHEQHIYLRIDLITVKGLTKYSWHPQIEHCTNEQPKQIENDSDLMASFRHNMNKLAIFNVKFLFLSWQICAHSMDGIFDWLAFHFVWKDSFSNIVTVFFFLVALLCVHS